VLIKKYKTIATLLAVFYSINCEQAEPMKKRRGEVSSLKCINYETENGTIVCYDVVNEGRACKLYIGGKLIKLCTKRFKQLRPTLGEALLQMDQAEPMKKGKGWRLKGINYKTENGTVVCYDVANEGKTCKLYIGGKPIKLCTKRFEQSRPEDDIVAEPILPTLGNESEQDSLFPTLGEALLQVDTETRERHQSEQDFQFPTLAPQEERRQGDNLFPRLPSIHTFDAECGDLFRSMPPS
jgi:hypothetical protein